MILTTTGVITMAKLIRPDNGQPAEYVTYLRGYVCLRLHDTITPAVRWFSDDAMFAANPMSTCAEPPPLIGCELPPVLVVTLTPELAANVNHAIGCEVKVVQPVSLWHESMTNAA